MIAKDNDKETYNTKICVLCKHRNNCDKNKFKTFVFKDKISIRCDGYEYENQIS